MNRLRISLKRREAITVDRISVGKLKLAYVICADKKLRYGKKRSRIAYIGTTKNGTDRFAQSAASRSDEVFDLRGIERFYGSCCDMHASPEGEIVAQVGKGTHPEIQGLFGAVPRCNRQGKHKNYLWSDEVDLFSVRRLETIIEDLS